MKIKELKKPSAMSGKLFEFTRKLLHPDPSKRPLLRDLLDFFSIETAVTRSEATRDSCSDDYPRDNETGNSEEENGGQNRSRSNGRLRTSTHQYSTQQDSYLTTCLVNPSQTDTSDCNTDLDNHNSRARGTGPPRKNVPHLKTKETSIALMNSYPRRPKTTALKNLSNVGTEDYAHLAEGGESGEEDGAGVPGYERMHLSDNSVNDYDDIHCHSLPTVRNLRFRKCESVSGIGVDPRVARQGHYDSDSSLDVGDVDYSEIDGWEKQANETDHEEDDETYETCP